jgi:hypothetical protein
MFPCLQNVLTWELQVTDLYGVDKIRLLATGHLVITQINININ